MNPPPDPQAATNDPVVRPVALCSGKSGRQCGSPMSPIRIYEGKGSRPEMRGAICQSCSSCYWTIFHTPAYNYEDAQRLLHRLRYPGHADGFPASLRPPETLARGPGSIPQATVSIPQATVQPAVNAPVLTQGNKILCSNLECRTIGGNRTQGSKTCIEYKCKRCCKSAAFDAAQNSRARRPCHAHSQPEIHATFQPASTLIPQPIPSFPQSQPITQVPQPAVQAIVPLSQPAAQDPPAASPPLDKQQKSLARPMGGTWAASNGVVAQKTQNAKTLKMEQQEIEERKKRTILLVVYYLNANPPLCLDQYIPTFPHFRLSACSELVKDLGLEENTRIDAWTGSEWITISIHGILPVEKGQRVILKIRPSLRQGLDDCPGIEEELKKAAKRGLRRPAVEFVSPIKAASQDNTARIQDRRPVPVLFPPSLPSTVEPNPQSGDFSSATSVSVPSTNLEPSSAPLVLHAPTTTRLNPSTLPSQPSQPLPSPKLKRWPFEFYVYEVHNGLCQMRDTLSGSVSRDQHRKHLSNKSKGKHTKRGRRITVKAAFRAAFPSAKWVKSTYYDHKTIWYQQERAIRELFIDLGESEQATYSRFLDAIDNPSRLPSPAALDPESSPPIRSSYLKKRRRSPSTSDSSDSDSESEASKSPSSQANCNKKHRKKHHPSPEADASDSNEGLGDFPTFNTPPPCDNLTAADNNIDPVLRFLPASPSSVSLDTLGNRVADLHELLEEIIMDPEESGFFQSLRGSFTAGSSLHKNTEGAFRHWNAAYYGLQGKHIITSRLRLLFPEVSFEKGLYHPLSWDAFIDEFLLPETLLLLIEEDKHLSRDNALNILHHTPSPPPRTPVKQEPLDLSLRRRSVTSPEVIDLTDSPPTVKQEVVDVETLFGSDLKGKGKERSDLEIIDLTNDSD